MMKMYSYRNTFQSLAATIYCKNTCQYSRFYAQFQNVRWSRAFHFQIFSFQYINYTHHNHV